MMSLTQVEYLGLPVIRRELNGLVLIEKKFQANHYLPTHNHEKLCFCTILRGKMQEVGEDTRVFTPMTTVFHPAGEIHYDQFGPCGAHVVTLEFGHQWQERLRLYSGWLQEPSEHKNNPITWLGLHIHREFQRLDSATPLAVEPLVLELLSRIIRNAKPNQERHPPKWLKTIENFLKEQFDESLSLDQLSQLAGVHPVHLIRTFRKFHGTTIGEYLRQRRIEHACKLLQNNSLSVTEVAVQSGFYDQSHFTRTFRAMVGLTPGQYRAQFIPK